MPEEHELENLQSESLHALYERVEELKSEEITCASKGVTVAGVTRMRVLLSTLTKLAKAARKELLEIKHGQVRSGRRNPSPPTEEG